MRKFKTMKNFKKTLLYINILYWIIYLIKSFIIWDFTNPYWWVLDLPNSRELRYIVLGALCFLGFYGFLCYTFLNERDEKKAKEDSFNLRDTLNDKKKPIISNKLPEWAMREYLSKFFNVKL